MGAAGFPNQILVLAPEEVVLYTLNTANEGKEGQLVATIVEVLRKAKLQPEQVKALGLAAGWQDKLPLEFLETVAELIEKNREALKELVNY